MALCTASADAAQLVNIVGNVSVNTGSGWKLVSGPTDVPAGAKIMLGEGASASLLYSEPCSVSQDLGANSTVTVLAQAVCTADATTTPGVTTGLIVAGVGGAVIGTVIVVSQQQQQASP